MTEVLSSLVDLSYLPFGAVVAPSMESGIGFLAYAGETLWGGLSLQESMNGRALGLQPTMGSTSWKCHPLYE